MAAGTHDISVIFISFSAFMSIKQPILELVAASCTDKDVAAGVNTGYA